MNKKKYNPLYKNFLNLKINPLNNNKFLKLKRKLIKHKIIKSHYSNQKKKIPIWRWMFVRDTKKKKWQEFLTAQIKSKGFFNRYKPNTHNSYKSSKFASQGNSFKKKFKNNLQAKTIFNYLYGDLSKKYLKAKMTEVYTYKTIKNPINLCTELFESRLDSVLYKAKFCKSIKNAQQLVSHKHVKVNGVIKKNKGYILKKGDLITFNPKSFKLIKENLKKEIQNSPNSIIWPLPPIYLNINYKTLEILMGNINNFNFSSSFTFKADFLSVITNSYRN